MKERERERERGGGGSVCMNIHTVHELKSYCWTKMIVFHD